ncbi:DNA adenine methylase [Planktotalea sp.]|uniref:DNA adenine methylase n=1 Tax=Planktotalea sp. TaxID=2029877 RepID=UPI003D6B3A70
MPRSNSPLRYPGGKSSMLALMAGILRENDLQRGAYAEPFAGGCGLALSLLYGGHVSEIHINDVDPAIWSFWHSVLNETDQIIQLVETAELSVVEWRRQREIFLEQRISDPVKLGFSAFFLNRTNRSGIIKGAGVIGGLQQAGNYKMDCRFNRSDLKKRIQRVAKYKSRIKLTRMDALEFIPFADKTLSQKALLCIDPPYFNKGSSLYTSFYVPGDHAALSVEIQNLQRPWVVTYDNVPEINSLYHPQPRFGFDVNYSVQTKRVATELLVASHHLVLPEEIEARRIA